MTAPFLLLIIIIFKNCITELRMILQVESLLKESRKLNNFLHKLTHIWWHIMIQMSHIFFASFHVFCQGIRSKLSVFGQNNESFLKLLKTLVHESTWSCFEDFSLDTWLRGLCQHIIIKVIICDARNVKKAVC